MNLLVIDLDGTLTKSDNLVGFSLFMLFNKGRIRFLLLFPLLVLLKLKLIDNIIFKIKYASLILKNTDVDKLTQSAGDYVSSKDFKKNLNMDVLGFIKQQHTENLILSANFDFIAKTVSHSLEINQCISVNLEQYNGKYTGLIKGVIPYGQNKVDVFQQFVMNKNFEKTIGIGDSISDLDLLSSLDEGYLIKYNSKYNSTSFIKVQVNYQ